MECCGFSFLLVFLVSVGFSQGISRESEVAMGQFQGIADEYYNWLNAANPEYASSRGILDNMGRTERMSTAKLEERKVKFEDFLTRLETIDMDLLPHQTQVSYLVLEQALRTVVSLHGFIKYGYNVVVGLGSFNPFTRLQSQFAVLPLNTKQDFMTYIERARSLTGTVNDLRQLMEEALRYKMVQNAISMSLNYSKLEVEDTNIYQTFQIGLNYSSLSKEDSDALLRQLYDALNRTVLPAYHNLTTFLLEQYLPRARPCDGLWCLENGTALYQAHLLYHLSINVTPEYIHQLGLREVTRIKGEMKKLFKKIGFNGTIKEFFEGLKTNTLLVYTNESDLLEYVKNLVYNKIEPALLKVFKKENIPTIPLVVRKMQGYGPFGFYRSGTKYSAFVINVKEPEKKPVLNLLPLALHEGLPGHHMQLSPRSSQASLPDFRRYRFISQFITEPVDIPKNAASTEGWALYAEKLGYDMGLYESPYDALGQLDMELFRACRLVIDSGLHAKRWTRQRALDYLVEHSNMPLRSLEFEIDRYITLPGQACAYKVGELRFLELRERARKALGSKFDLKEFHHTVLSVGSRVPLGVYDHVINWWINQTLSSSSTSVHSDLLEYVKNLVYNKIEPALLKVFKKENIPTIPLVVRKMQGYGPFGFYRSGTKYSAFVINVKEPEKKPVLNLLPLALHEGLPGHHMQLSPRSSQASLPDFRRYRFISQFITEPVDIPKNAASTEGWALYAEKLGYDMGLYESPYDALGQLDMELFRACRLVIDSGLHAKRWTRQRALDYLVEHSNMPLRSLEFEIDRYITLPGQACAYKVGELRFLELRERARKALGSKFDLKEFHHTVLSVGSRVPLGVYDHVINWWINQTLSSSSTSVHVTVSIYWTFIFCLFGVVF